MRLGHNLSFRHGQFFLTIRQVSILDSFALKFGQFCLQMACLFSGTFQIIALVVSSMTVALTSKELYFLQAPSRRDSEGGWLEVVKQSLYVTPYFLLNSLFKILSVSLIFATFKLWGLLNIILWASIYTSLIALLHEAKYRGKSEQRDHQLLLGMLHSPCYK